MGTSTNTELSANAGKLDRLIDMLDKHRYGYTAGMVLAVMALGAICMTEGGIDYILRMTICLLPTEVVLCLYIAIAPMRLLFYACAATVVIDLCVLSTAWF